MLTVFGDESVDSPGQKVFVCAGLLGDEHQWAALRKAWTNRLNGKIFHASDCECDQKDFTDIPHTENLALYKDLTVILTKSGLIGFGVGIDLAGSKKYFPDTKEENPYLACFLRTVKYLAEKAQQCVPSSNVEVTFDQHPGNEYNAGLIYQYMKLESQGGDWSAGAILAEKVRFASRKEPGIQAADLWAREVMKGLEGYFENRPRRKSMSALEATGLFGADYLLEGFYKDLKAQYYALQQKTGIYPHGYAEWLGKRQDNESNRILYLMFTAQNEHGKTHIRSENGGAMSEKDKPTFDYFILLARESWEKNHTDLVLAKRVVEMGKLFGIDISLTPVAPRATESATPDVPKLHDKVHFLTGNAVGTITAITQGGAIIHIRLGATDRTLTVNDLKASPEHGAGHWNVISQ
jgi:hypothetical protein